MTARYHLSLLLIILATLPLPFATSRAGWPLWAVWATGTGIGVATLIVYLLGRVDGRAGR
jgi:hypothetical protein